MPTTLLDVITYDGKRHGELTTEKGRNLLEYMALKLKDLEPEILAYPAGRIAIRISGNVFVSNYPPMVADRINQAVQGL